MGQLSPVPEEPIEEDHDEEKRARSKKNSWSKWIKFKPIFSLLSTPKKSNLRILLSVLACPLSPISIPPSLPLHVSSKAQYIIQQFRATTTKGVAMESAMKSLYASGKVVMSMASPSLEESTSARQRGSFVLWQMEPRMWLVELVVDGWKVSAGSDAKVAWRNTPWIGTHAAPGGVRPLRRALQGLNPSIIMSIFSSAQYMGEKWIEGESCFALMLEVDQSTLLKRSDSTAEIIKHVMVGHFSQRSGLLVHLEDFQLTRIQTLGVQPIYWETNMASSIRDYRSTDSGMLIAHSGQTILNMMRFGQGIKDHHETMRMEEEWNIHDVAFNVPGLSVDTFAPPEEIKM